MIEIYGCRFLELPFVETPKSEISNGQSGVCVESVFLVGQTATAF
jgi:hypothetical protein